MTAQSGMKSILVAKPFSSLVTISFLAFMAPHSAPRNEKRNEKTVAAWLE